MILEMIHWDWIATGIAGYLLIKSVSILLNFVSEKLYPMNRAILRQAVAEYAPTAVPKFDEHFPEAAISHEKPS
jgi:hypothetical protein